jgi:hypothetical protein
VYYARDVAMLQIRITDAEKDALRQRAAQAGVTMSAYARQVLLGDGAPVSLLDEERVREIAREEARATVVKILENLPPRFSNQRVPKQYRHS